MLKVSSRFTEGFSSNANQRFTSSSGRMFQGIRVITLDALNTLIRLEQSPGHTYADFAKHVNIQCNADELNKAFRRNFKNLSKQKLCYGFGKDGEMAWWIELVKNCFADIGKKSAELDKLAHKLFVYYGSVKPWRLVDNQVHDHLKELQSRKIRLGVISNFDRRLRDILKGLKLSSYFEILLLSGEIGMEKPNKQIFEKAAKYFQISQMEDMLHVGDDEEKDFNGARKAGARAALLNPDGVSCNNKEHAVRSLKDIIDELE
ncbi:HAD-superfamily hydrolase [Loa loa]|uniref:HAD-superfamily hydrolase n=1 Tax=Loa loa TaxID=7209 RepID=A0A1I7VV20_LOALO|nr:HAD-superfamily hydrolase [Loa loa]EFO27347.1 HAD-superfamily hydrolase [Loa loa]